MAAVDVWRLKLLKCSEELSADLSFDMVSPTLIERGILSADEYASIRELPSNRTRIEKVVETILSKPESVYNQLISLLEADYDWLASQLQQTSVNAEDLHRFKQLMYTKSLRGIESTNNNLTSFKEAKENSPPVTVPSVSQGLPKDIGESRAQTNSSETGPTCVAAGLLGSNRGQDPTNGMTCQTSYPVNSAGQSQVVNQTAASVSRPPAINTQLDRNPSSTNPTHPQYSTNPSYQQYSTNPVDQQSSTNVILPHSAQGNGVHPMELGHPFTFSAINSYNKSSSMSTSSILSTGSVARPCNSVILPGSGSPLHPGSIPRPASPLRPGSFPRSAGSVHLSGSSPLHSSDLSIFSGPTDNSSIAGSVGNIQGRTKRSLDEDEEISEEMIEFVSMNPMIMRKWQNLAHQVGLSNRVPVIQARIRQDGRDFDEHITEFLREWGERKPGEATVGGLVKLLRKLRFNDTAGKIEDGSYKKKLKSF